MKCDDGRVTMTRRQFVEAASMMGAVGLVELSGCARPHDQAVLPAPPVASLREVGASRGILAGCAIQIARLRDTPAYAQLVREQAGIVVEENAFKFTQRLRPSPTEFFFGDTDYLVQFAEANGMKVRGHNFVWHRSLPAWFDGYMTPANAEAVLVEHIERVGGRYAGRIHSWDVMNEAIRVEDGLPGGMRDTPWRKLLGDGYIDSAFRTARRVDPKALLVYNDYGIEGEGDKPAAKREAVTALLRGMQQRGVPVDALGVQSHLDAGRGDVYGPGLMAMLAEVRAMGLKVLLTEMDVNDKWLASPIPARDAGVAEVYGNYLKTTLADPGVIALLTWGITDRYTWLNGEASRSDKLPERDLPFDVQLQPKPAFFAELEALRGAPRRG